MSFFGDGDATDDILGNDQFDRNINAEDELPGGSDDEHQNELGSGDDEEGKKVEPKRKVLRNPRPILNIDTLKGKRGIHTIENYFTDIKFHGKGNEKKDLDEVMRRMQHWAHRMYPSYSFDDVLLNIERIGKQKPLHVFMNRYRLDQLEFDILQDDGNIDDNIPLEANAEPFDEFDALLDEQISKTIPTKTPGGVSVSSSMFNTPHLNKVNAVMSTPYTRYNFDDSELAVPLPPSPNRNDSEIGGEPTLTECLPAPITNSLTSEQLAKIAENRRIAQEKLKAKREAAAMVTISESEGFNYF